MLLALGERSVGGEHLTALEPITVAVLGGCSPPAKTHDPGGLDLLVQGVQVPRRPLQDLRCRGRPIGLIDAEQILAHRCLRDVQAGAAPAWCLYTFGDQPDRHQDPGYRVGRRRGWRPGRTATAFELRSCGEIGISARPAGRSEPEPTSAAGGSSGGGSLVSRRPWPR